MSNMTRAFISRQQLDQVFAQTLGSLCRGQSEQGILEVSDVRKYEIGARLAIEEMNMVFRYAYADPDRQLRAAYAVYGNLLMTETGVVVANAAIGARSIVCTAIADVVADQFKNGKMVVSTGAGYGTQYRILSNTAAAMGDTFTVVLKDPLVVGLTAGGDEVTLYRNPYAEVHSMRQEIIDGVAPNYHKVSWVGVPNRFVPAAHYCWLQTWGPCFVVESHDMGSKDDIRMTYFSDDGSLGEMVDNEAAGTITYSFQIAGPILPVTTAGDVVPSGLALIMLMIAP
jgi:hypothetical protein